MVKKVRFFKLMCKSNTKFHITVGHTTIVANAVFYGADKADKATGVSEGKLGKNTHKGVEIIQNNKIEINNDTSSNVNDNDNISYRNDDGHTISDIISNNGDSNNDSNNMEISKVAVDTKLTGDSTKITGVSTKITGDSIKLKEDSTISSTSRALNSAYEEGFPLVPYPWENDFESQESLAGTENMNYGQEPLQWVCMYIYIYVYMCMYAYM
jgi:hypothetical protein